MYTLLRQYTPQFLVVGGGLWLFQLQLASFHPATKALAFLGPLALAVGFGGLHLHYRVYRRAFYEEVGFVGILLGLLTNLIALSMFTPDNLSSTVGNALSTLPFLVSLTLLAVGAALFGSAFVITGILPRSATVFFVAALPLQAVLSVTLPFVIGFEPPVPLFAISCLVLAGVTCHSMTDKGTISEGTSPRAPIQ